MDPPIVYIEKESFLTMVLASVETFNRECFGYIFGYKPSRHRNSFVITNAVAVQLAKKRKNTEIDQSDLSYRNMWKLFSKYPTLFRVVGDFHSHPEWGHHKRIANFSDGDIADMIEKEYPIGVVIKISSLNKERILWESAGDGGIRGSLGKYKFHINVCRVVKDGDKHISESLIIQASAAIKYLNRALGY